MHERALRSPSPGRCGLRFEALAPIVTHCTKTQRSGPFYIRSHSKIREQPRAALVRSDKLHPGNRSSIFVRMINIHGICQRFQTIP